VNYSNYTLNPENIINKYDMKNDKFYQTFLKEQIFDYKTDLKNEMKEKLQNHEKFTNNLKSIHQGHGSYHLPANPGSKLPVFRNQSIYIDDYKQILKDR
jgi:hypothetical protein